MTEKEARKIFTEKFNIPIKKVKEYKGNFIFLAYKGDDMIKALDPWFIVYKNGDTENLLFDENPELFRQIMQEE